MRKLNLTERNFRDSSVSFTSLVQSEVSGEACSLLIGWPAAGDDSYSVSSLSAAILLRSVLQPCLIQLS